MLRRPRTRRSWDAVIGFILYSCLILCSPGGLAGKWCSSTTVAASGLAPWVRRWCHRQVAGIRRHLGAPRSSLTLLPPIPCLIPARSVFEPLPIPPPVYLLCNLVARAAATHFCFLSARAARFSRCFSTRQRYGARLKSVAHLHPPPAPEGSPQPRSRPYGKPAVPESSARSR